MTLKTKKIPMRLCIGCGEMKPKKDLIRVLKDAEGTIQLDFTGKKSGRGAYLCKSMECFAAAQKKPRRPAGLLLCVLCVRRERKSHKEGKFLWMLLYYPEKLAKS